MSSSVNSEVVLGLADCLDQIERQLGWGPSKEWVSYDFDKLSDTINEATGVRLSNNTLKRVWGKLEYKSLPSTTTLNGLAQFLGFEDWRMFLVRNDVSNTISSTNTIPFRWKKMYFALLLFTLAIIVCLAFLNDSAGSLGDRDSNNFTFSYDRITNDIPNSVVFHYDVLSGNLNAKVEIQQNWDVQKRAEVSNRDTIATSIYYTPGYFDAKLVVNNEIVKRKGLLIPSNGWLGLMENTGQPIYFNKTDIVGEDGVNISNELIEITNRQNGIKDRTTHIYNIQDFKDLTLDDFNLETVLQNITSPNSQVCQTSDLTIYCEGQVILIPLTFKGCIANIDLLILERQIDGKTNDLSKFGVEQDSPVSIKVKSLDGQIDIYVNDVIAYSTSLGNNGNRKVHGIRYRFQGAGGIEQFALGNSGTTYLSI